MRSRFSGEFLLATTTAAVTVGAVLVAGCGGDVAPALVGAEVAQGQQHPSNPGVESEQDPAAITARIVGTAAMDIAGRAITGSQTGKESWLPADYEGANQVVISTGCKTGSVAIAESVIVVLNGNRQQPPKKDDVESVVIERTNKGLTKTFTLLSPPTAASNTYPDMWTATETDRPIDLGKDQTIHATVRPYLINNSLRKTARGIVTRARAAVGSIATCNATGLQN